MASRARETAFIVGAGFSAYAGLPLQSAFTDELLRGREFAPGPSKYIVSELEKFVRNTFGHSRPDKARNWPALEDIFTCVDLSANSGHYLGPKYPPVELRRIRGLLISRIIRMLDQYCERAKRKNAPEWKAMLGFFGVLDLERCAFVSMNWDTVVERFIAGVETGRDIDYRCGAIKAVFPEETWVIETTKRKENNVPVVKVHGSVNWLYCDNCRNLFWFPADEALRIADQILRDKDWRVLGEKKAR
jgi:hypothetical protein